MCTVKLDRAQKLISGLGGEKTRWSACAEELGEEYEKLTQDNKIATTEKETAVKYKTKDQKETEAALIGLKEDKEGVTKELDAVLESAWLYITST